MSSTLGRSRVSELTWRGLVKGQGIVKLGIISDGEVRHSKTNREQSQVQVAESHLPIQLLLQLSLDRPSVGVRVESRYEHGCCDNDDDDHDSDHDCDLAHGILP